MTQAPPALAREGWLVVFAACVGVFCGLGLGRFAFGMLLPSMSGSLGLSYSQGGVLGFANMLGYLISVLLVPILLPRLGTQKLASLSLAAVALTLVAMAFAPDFRSLAVIYFGAGLGAGGLMLPAMSVAAQWFPPAKRGLAGGFAISGAGFGIILTGAIVPRLSPMGELESWQVGWLTFGLICAVSLLIVMPLLRDKPKLATATPQHVPSPSHGKIFARANLWLILGLLVTFAIYGTTYMIYVTFIVTSMVDDFGLSESTAGQLWAIFGFISLGSGVAFGWISDKIGRPKGFALSFAVMGLAFGLVGMGQSMAALATSVLLFGAVAWSVPVIMAASAGDYFGPASAAAALSFLTLAFSFGQAVGPVIAGGLASISGSFESSFQMAAALAAFACAISFCLRPATR